MCACTRNAVRLSAGIGAGFSPEKFTGYRVFGERRNEMHIAIGQEAPRPDHPLAAVLDALTI